LIGARVKTSDVHTEFLLCPQISASKSIVDYLSPGQFLMRQLKQGALSE